MNPMAAFSGIAPFSAALTTPPPAPTRVPDDILLFGISDSTERMPSSLNICSSSATACTPTTEAPLLRYPTASFSFSGNPTTTTTQSRLTVLAPSPRAPLVSNGGSGYAAWTPTWERSDTLYSSCLYSPDSESWSAIDRASSMSSTSMVGFQLRLLQPQRLSSPPASSQNGAACPQDAYYVERLAQAVQNRILGSTPYPTLHFHPWTPEIASHYETWSAVQMHARFARNHTISLQSNPVGSQPSPQERTPAMGQSPFAQELRLVSMMMLGVQPTTTSVPAPTPFRPPVQFQPPRSSSSLGHGGRTGPCAHLDSWRRVRSKKGYNHFKCDRCDARWRVMTNKRRVQEYFEANPQARPSPSSGLQQ